MSEFSSYKKEKKNKKHKIKYNPKEAFIVDDRGKLITISLPIIFIIVGLWLLLK